jgi:hypothetical protein
MKKACIYLSLLAASVFTLCAQPTLTLSIVGTGQIRAGSTVQVQVLLSGSTGLNVAAWQSTIKSTAGGTWTATNGPASVAAGKSFSCATVTEVFNCINAGINSNILTDGIVGTYNLDIPTNATPGQVSIILSNLLAASLQGNAVALSGNQLNFTLASPLSRCDINGDDTINVQDVTLIINQVLGLAACSADLDGDGKCAVPDVVRVINATLGGACRVGI